MPSDGAFISAATISRKPSQNQITQAHHAQELSISVFGDGNVRAHEHIRTTA